MPGKVNPVIPEAMLMVCAQVIGNDATVAWAGASGIFELNVMMPVIGPQRARVDPAARATPRACSPTRASTGSTPTSSGCARYAESSPSIVTPLNPRIGYEAAAKVAKQALKDGMTIREAVIDLGFVERGELTEEQLDAALDVDAMTRKE